MKTFINSLLTRKQGQSTMEYLLVILLASTFVFILFLQFSPGLKSTLNQARTMLAQKIAGGKLISHVKVDSQQGPGAAFKGAPAASQEQPGAEGGPSASAEGPGDEGGVGGAASGAAPSRGDEISFLDAGETGVTAEGSSDVVEERKASASAPTPGAARDRGSEIEKSRADSEQGAKASSKDEREGDSKGSRIAYSEGEEEAVFRGSKFNWWRIFLILLIIMVVGYIGFEIYKATKLGRPGS